LTLVCALPDKTIKKNIKASCDILLQEGPRHNLISNNFKTTLDGFSDSVILNINYCINPKRPFESMIKIFQYQEASCQQAEMLQNLANNNLQPNITYSRYWFGNLVFIRPLLFLFDYSQIRIIYNLAFYLLFSYIIYLIFKKINLLTSIYFILAMLSCNFFVIPFCLSYSSIYFIMFISLIYLLKKFTDIKYINTLSILAFVIGALTSSCDLLTAPSITLSFYLVTALLIINKHDYIKHAHEIFILSLKIAFAWSFGYLLTWATKWLLADLIYHQGVINTAIDQILLRTYFKIPEHIALKLIFISSINYMPISIIIIIILSLFISSIYILKITLSKIFISLLFATFIPIVWLILLRNHTYCHSLFAYRNLSSCVYSILALQSQNIFNKNSL